MALDGIRVMPDLKNISLLTVMPRRYSDNPGRYIALWFSGHPLPGFLSPGPELLYLHILAMHPSFECNF